MPSLNPSSYVALDMAVVDVAHNKAEAMATKRTITAAANQPKALRHTQAAPDRKANRLAGAPHHNTVPVAVIAKSVTAAMATLAPQEQE